MDVALKPYTPLKNTLPFQQFQDVNLALKLPLSNTNITFPLKLKKGTVQAIQDAKMHGVATILMGFGSLVMNLIPGLRMPWKSALLMAPFHMAWMLLINLSLGFIKGFQSIDSPH